jgi:hypothetical protein
VESWGDGAGGDAVAEECRSVDASAVGPAAEYLAVLARTPFDGLVLPIISLRATVVRGDESAETRILALTVDPEVGYHYGTPVADVATTTAVRVEALTPPQVARHAGYETVFRDLDSVRVTRS